MLRRVGLENEKQRTNTFRNCRRFDRVVRDEKHAKSDDNIRELVLVYDTNDCRALLHTQKKKQRF